MPVSDKNEVFHIGVEGGSTTFFREPDIESGYVYFYSVSNSISIDDVDPVDEEASEENRPSKPRRKGPFPTVQAALSNFSPNGEWVSYFPVRILSGYRMLIWELRRGILLQTGEECPPRVNERWARKCGVLVMKKPDSFPLRRMPRSEVAVLTLEFEGGMATVKSGTTTGGVRYFYSKCQGSGGFDGDIPESGRSRKLRTPPPLFTSLKDALDSIAGASQWLTTEPREINADFLEGLKATFADAIADEETSAYAKANAASGWQEH
jgi:hypothetical protein